MMGGQVGARSEVGRGSEFSFTLPLESLAVEIESAADANARRSARVLLVDDNATSRHLLAGQIQDAGHDVATAASAREALQMLQANGAARSFDIAVIDFQMPGMDGAMLGEQIMSSRDIAPLRLVLLTSLDRSDEKQRFAEIGFAAYLTKPVRARELFSCLQRALAHAPQNWHLRSQSIITRTTLSASGSSSYSGRVLLPSSSGWRQC